MSRKHRHARGATRRTLRGGRRPTSATYPLLPPRAPASGSGGRSAPTGTPNPAVLAHLLPPRVRYHRPRRPAAALSTATGPVFATRDRCALEAANIRREFQGQNHPRRRPCQLPHDRDRLPPQLPPSHEVRRRRTRRHSQMPIEVVKDVDDEPRCAEPVLGTQSVSHICRVQESRLSVSDMPARILFRNITSGRPFPAGAGPAKGTDTMLRWHRDCWHVVTPSGLRADGVDPSARGIPDAAAAREPRPHQGTAADNPEATNLQGLGSFGISNQPIDYCSSSPGTDSKRRPSDSTAKLSSIFSKRNSPSTSTPVSGSREMTEPSCSTWSRDIRSAR